MLELCVRAMQYGLMLKYHPGVHTIEVQTKSGLYWARIWKNEETGKVCIVADMNGQMIEMAEPGVMLDIGANVGRYTIPMATKASRVFAFEPEPRNFQKLCEHTNQYPNVIPVPYGVSDEIGETEMHLCGRWGEHTMIPELIAEEIKETIMIQTKSIDSFVKEWNLSNITAIKIDVEGNEGKVLAGAIETLKNESPLIALETHIHADLKTVQEVLFGCGYEIMASHGQIINSLLPDIQVICRKPKKD